MTGPTVAHIAMEMKLKTRPRSVANMKIEEDPYLTLPTSRKVPKARHDRNRKEDAYHIFQSDSLDVTNLSGKIDGLCPARLTSPYFD